MREKKLWLVITFHTTAAAIAMEKLCRAQGLPGRLIPVPRELTADCGMAWRAGTEEQGAVRFSFGWYNTEEEADAAVNALREIAT